MMKMNFHRTFFKPALLKRIRRIIFCFDRFYLAGVVTDEQERLSALNCFESKPGRVYIIKSKDHWGL